MVMIKEYNADFFADVNTRGLESAKTLVPFVLKTIEPKSVVDVGCGLGSWLAVIRDLGVTDVLGLDGDYVDRAKLEIPAEQFRACNLSQPPRLERTFDMALTLEVAEHLPPASADDFVEFLTRLAPVVVFSAAVPFQGGTLHFNEQWPDYWAEKFARRNFVLIDAIRSTFWDEEAIDPMYVQNGFIYVRADALDNYPTLKVMHEAGRKWPLRMVHPRLFEKVQFYLTPEHIRFKLALRLFLGAVQNRILFRK